MTFALTIMLLAAGLFVGMVLLQEVGRRIGVRHLTQDPEGMKAGIGVVGGAVFALLGLLIAFTFSGAAARFDTRRQLVVEEANAIGTAYLRLDLLSATARDGLRERFRKYVDARLEVYRALPDPVAVKQPLERSLQLQGSIWTEAVSASQSKESPPAAAMLLLPALNQMIDLTTTRTMAGQMHPPTIIFVLLFVLGLGCSLMAGYEMAGGKKRNWTVILGFAAVMAVTVYVILDLEYPRQGLIRVDAFDRVLVELRDTMQ